MLEKIEALFPSPYSGLFLNKPDANSQEYIAISVPLFGVIFKSFTLHMSNAGEQIKFPSPYSGLFLNH